MIRTLQDRVVHEKRVAVHMECTALSLLLDGGAVAGVLAYWRETGRLFLLKARAVIIATGGGGRAWRFTSNSWEYTGDGFALAYDAGAELIDMEFTQFHPTGMVWPPSVRGILVTEGVRGDGGVLKNRDGDRFMFKYIPEKFAAETADTVEEADRWLVDSEKNRRPPELLTRDVVARAITREVVEGRGSPHGGVFLDIASRRPPDFIKRKLPVDVPPVQGAGRRRHHRRADGGGPDAALLHGRHPGARRHPAVDRARPLRRRRMHRRHARRQPPGRQLALRSARLRPPGRRRRRRLPARAGAPAGDRHAAGRGGGEAGDRPAQPSRRA